MVTCGCSSEKSAAELAAADPEKPKYASPWDKPITRLYGPAADETTAIPRGAEMSALLSKAGIATAGAGTGAAGSGARSGSPSPWDPVAIPGPVSGGSGRVKPGASDWSISLASFGPESDPGAAQRMLSKIRGLPGMSEAFVDSRGRTQVLAYGRYDAPGSAKATKDLQRIRELTLDGVKPFVHAMLTPPAGEQSAGSVPELELRNARRVHGDDVKYTLQIGVYWRSDGVEPTAKELTEFRATAEKAAADLRREGEEAYYYHGPRKSMVTIGAFNEKEYDPSPQQKNPLALPNQAPRLLKLREKYPYNLENGRAIKRMNPGASEGRIDPSFVVMIPE